MNGLKELIDNMYSDATPGMPNIILRLLGMVFGAVVIVLTTLYAVNFVCGFAGIDFDAFSWVSETWAILPDLLDSTVEAIKSLIDTAAGIINQ